MIRVTITNPNPTVDNIQGVEYVDETVPYGRECDVRTGLAIAQAWPGCEFSVQQYVSKADLIPADDLAVLDHQPCAHECEGCGEVLETEGQFARHFALYNRVYLNLGYCPVEGHRSQGKPPIPAAFVPAPRDPSQDS